MFEKASARFCIGSIDDVDLPDVSATYNPKELQFDRAVSWKSHQDAELEFDRAQQGRTLSVELFFDGFETNTSVAPQVDLLEVLATVRESGALEGALRRAHFCVALWGDAGIPRLCCVIESVSTKYTMFSPTGVPLRAVCTVKLKEANVFTRETAFKRDYKLWREGR